MIFKSGLRDLRAWEENETSTRGQETQIAFIRVFSSFKIISLHFILLYSNTFICLLSKFYQKGVVSD